jgi:mRNA interferase MazF
MIRGEIVLVNYPFTDGSGSKMRPVLVVSVDQFNGGRDIIVTPISSSVSVSDPSAVLVNAPHFSIAGLKTASSIKWTKLLTIEKSIVARKLGSLPHSLLDEVTKKIVSVLVPANK